MLFTTPTNTQQRTTLSVTSHRIRATMFSALGVMLLLPFSADAASPLSRAKSVASSSGISTTGSLTDVVGKIINAALGLVGVVFLVLTVYAGFLWMTAGGNEEKVAKAKKLITSSVIGLIIVLAAYSIATFVVGTAINTTAGTTSE